MSYPLSGWWRLLLVLVVLPLITASGQQPGPVPPGARPGMPPDPSQAVLVDSPALRTHLGSLCDQLQLCVTMDMAKGGVAFGRSQAMGSERILEMLEARLARFVGTVRFIEDTGRKCADFAEADSSVQLFLQRPMGPAARGFTLAAWMKFPAPGDSCVIWKTSGSTPLAIVDRRFVCMVNARASAPASPGATPAPQAVEVKEFAPVGAITGWHHIAVTCDGTQTSFFLDGVRKSTLTIAMNLVGNLTMGGGKLPASVSTLNSDKPAQCGLLDDLFIFSSALTEGEIKVVSTAPVAPGELVAPAPRPGVAKVPNPAAATPAPGESVPDTDSTVKAVAAELLKKSSSSLVFVTGADGNGSGFAGKLGNATCLFTNAHVAAGVRNASFKKLNGEQVQLGTPAIAVGHDVFCAALPATTPTLEVMQGVEQNASIGDDVVVLGNAEGGGVVNTIIGKIVGIGPDRVEVDAPFQPGNSGSPILHLKSGKVIGVATYLTIKKYDATTKEVLKTPIIRRFGFRLDSVKTWQPVNWQLFFAQAVEMEKIETLTYDLEKFLVDLAKNDGKVTTSAHTNPAIKSRIEQWQGSKRKGMTDKDIVAANQNFLAFLKNACRADILNAQQRMTYDYFQRQLTEEAGYRKEFAEIFDKIIKEIGQ